MEPNGTNEPGSGLDAGLDAAAQLAAEAEGHAGTEEGQGARDAGLIEDVFDSCNNAPNTTS